MASVIRQMGPSWFTYTLSFIIIDMFIEAILIITSFFRGHGGPLHKIKG